MSKEKKKPLKKDIMYKSINDMDIVKGQVPRNRNPTPPPPKKKEK